MKLFSKYLFFWMKKKAAWQSQKLRRNERKRSRNIRFLSKCVRVCVCTKGSMDTCKQEQLKMYLHYYTSLTCNMHHSISQPNAYMHFMFSRFILHMWQISVSLILSSLQYHMKRQATKLFSHNFIHSLVISSLTTGTTVLF